MAGLACARRLRDAGRSVQLLEASDAVGGRVRTDVVDGFRLDRGFQVLLTAYPAVQDELAGRMPAGGRFRRGALVRHDGRFHRIADPGDDFLAALRGTLSPVLSLTDGLRLLRWRRRVLGADPEELLRGPPEPASVAFRSMGFTDSAVAAFLAPLLGGALMDPELGVSRRIVDFVFRAFAAGDALLPRGGMREVPRALLEDLPSGAVRTGTRIAAIRAGHARAGDGSEYHGRAVVVATDGPEADRLLGEVHPRRYRSCTTVYFASDRPPLEGPHLILNGEGRGMVNHVAVLSEVEPSYAPSGAALVAACVVGPASLRDEDETNRAARKQLREWFGQQVDGWRYLRTYRIPRALPSQEPADLLVPRRPVRMEPGVYLCGDHRENSTLHGAIRSGRRAADALLQDES